jgi:hypothetical protein
MVTNTTPNAALQQRFFRCGKQLAELIAGRKDAVPKTDDGSSDLCLSHALRGSCNANCRRKAAHRQLSVAEVARLSSFLKELGCE